MIVMVVDTDHNFIEGGAQCFANAFTKLWHLEQENLVQHTIHHVGISRGMHTRDNDMNQPLLITSILPGNSAHNGPRTVKEFSTPRLALEWSKSILTCGYTQG